MGSSSPPSSYTSYQPTSGWSGQEIQRRERSQTFGSGQGSAATTSGGGQPARGPYQRRNFGTASAVLAGGQQTRPQCVFCGGTHDSDKCRQLRDVDLGKRQELVRNRGLCFRCLGHHVAKTCSKTCYFCHHNHHRVSPFLIHSYLFKRFYKYF